MKKRILLNLCLVSTALAAGHMRNEEKIRQTITQRAERLMLTKFRQPPISLGNISTIDQLLSQFKALQAEHLTQEYNAILANTIQEAIADQHKHNYMAILDQENFTIIMHRRTDNAFRLFLTKAVGDLEEIRETGRPDITPMTAPPPTITALTKKAIQKLRDEINIRSIMKNRGEQIMLDALQQPPIQLGNMTSIDQVLDHLNALQAQHLTQEYLTIIKQTSEQAIKDQHEQDYMRVLSDEMFKTIMESRIDSALKNFVPRVVEAIEKIRETGRP